jgi:hypothetical protein
MSAKASSDCRPARSGAAQTEARGSWSLMVGIGYAPADFEAGRDRPGQADAGPRLNGRAAPGPLRVFAESQPPSAGGKPVPFWDAGARELRLDGLLVKRFRQCAPNQQTILAVFQEEGWPSFIDDPLPGGADQVPRERLRQTIHNLNRAHQNKLIHFSADGSGQRVLWARVERAPPGLGAGRTSV